jgi:hypothetical protein
LVTAHALGYVNVAVEDARDGLAQVVAVIGRDLAVCAEQAGHELAGIFADVRGRSEQGFYALVATVRQREDVAAVIVQRVDDLGQVGCLAGADVRTAERYLRARVLAVDTEGMPTRAPVARAPGNPAQLAGAAATAGPGDARSAAPAWAWEARNRLADPASGDGGRQR